MSSLTGFVKRIRDIMWNDAGVNGDAQRIEQMAWILFLKVYNTKEEEWRYATHLFRQLSKSHHKGTFSLFLRLYQ